MTTEALGALEALAERIPLADTLDAPNWGDCGQTWAAYVPAEVRAVWDELPREAKIMAVIFGEALVATEHWE